MVDWCLAAEFIIGRVGGDLIAMFAVMPLVDQRLVPAPDGGYDFAWIGAPDEGSGFLIVLVNEAVDGGLEVDNRMEDACFRRRQVNVAKKPSTASSHEHDVGTKWNIHRPMTDGP